MVVTGTDEEYDGNITTGMNSFHWLSYLSLCSDSTLPVMQCCGVVDVEGTQVVSEEKFWQALHGLYVPHSKAEHRFLPDEFPSQMYRVGAADNCLLVDICGSGNGPCNEYDSEHLMKAFFTLFPFGVGGFGWKNRRLYVGWERQFASLLQQSHGLYAKHEVFMFVTFNILQRRTACLGAKLVTRNSSLNQVANLLHGLNYKEVKERLTQSRKSGQRDFIRDPKLAQLQQLTGIANGMVRGSPEYIRNRRTEIRGLFVRFGTAMFFITINPDDTRHILILKFAFVNGEEYQLPTSEGFDDYVRMRYKIISENPVVQAQFFDTVFSAIIDVIFGVNNDERIGIFGKLAAYYAMIESQGKGMLHGHCLVWLVDGITMIYI